MRREIESGTLSARCFQEAIGTGSGARNPDQGQNQGLSVSDADQSLLQQLVQVETQLADARSRYRTDSSMVRGLEARLNQLQPLLQANQLEAVDAALSLNAGRIATAREQEQELSKNQVVATLEEAVEQLVHLQRHSRRIDCLWWTGTIVVGRAGRVIDRDAGRHSCSAGRADDGGQTNEQ